MTYNELTMLIISDLVYLAGAAFVALLIRTALGASHSAELSVGRSRLLRFGAIFLGVCLVLGMIGAIVGGAADPTATPTHMAISGGILLLGWYSVVGLVKTRTFVR